MSPLAQHMRTHLVDGRVIAMTPAERRIAMRTIFRITANTTLLAVSLVDSHLHLLGGYSRSRASKLVHAIEAGLKQRLSLPVGFAMYPHKPIRDAHHLRTAFRYVLCQHEHHGVRTDPLREGTNLPDLLGLRLVGAQTRRTVRRWLPRLSNAQLMRWLDITALEPKDGPRAWICDAALSAACLPTLTGKSPRVRSVRRAVLEVLSPRCTSAELASLLQVSQRAVQRLRHQPVDDALVHAIRLQLGHRAQLAERESGLPY